MGLDLEAGTVEIECIVQANDIVDGLADGEILLQRICDGAEFSVNFAGGRRLNAGEWRIVDESALAVGPAR